ncbi:MAG: BfmA/BtgA family mobilization protein [Mucilaginibacter sp.]|uniref:BfmA/BtgA family mobilization protein n=1 Tax=Mucilaginibacter sp. TaxID=1882438 RepID=UPI00326672EE
MEDINVKSIRYPQAVDVKMEKLALKLGRTKRALFIQMVDYFYKSKKDPADLNDEMLKKELSNGINRIISFFKTQEQDLLQPTFTQANTLVTIANRRTEWINKLNDWLNAHKKTVDHVDERIGVLEKAMEKTQKNLDDKALLKSRFNKILEYYISQRESLGWPVSAAKKEELQAQVRQSLQNL